MSDPFDAAAPWWRRKAALVAWCCVAALVWWLALREPSPVWLPGQSIAAEPEQTETEREAWKWGKDTTIEPLAEYRVEARVLGREDYSDAGAWIAPMDLALGWGPMSDQGVLDQLNMDQGGRWYHYSWSGSPPIPVGDIITHSANTHIIPATPQVARDLDRIHTGDRVRLSGVLVSVRRADGWHWRSSLTRKDTGDGACELFWVEDAEKLNMEGLAVDDTPVKR